MRTWWIAIASSLAVACTTPSETSGPDFSGPNNSDPTVDAGTPTTTDDAAPTPDPDPDAGEPPMADGGTTPTPDAAPPPPPSSGPTYATQHPRIYMTANKARLQAALTANGAAAARFKSVVDSWVGGADLWGFRAWNSALMGQLTGNAGYCTKAVAVIETQVATAETAIAAGQRPAVANDSYLEVGDLIGDLALVYDWCFTSLTTTQKTRWLAYADQAVWNVWHPTQAKWGTTTFTWSGWSTNDPSDNYYYSFLRSTMLLGLAAHGESTQGDGWLTQFRDTKIMGQLVPTFTADLTGGGSREGTGYGVAMRNLWKLYDLWFASTGEDLASKTGHTRASMLAFMHQVVPTLDRIAPTGDLSRDSTAAFFDYHRDYLQTLVALYPNDGLARRAKKLLEGASVQRMGNQFMAVDDFLYEDASVSATPIDLNTAYYAPGIGELYARSSWGDPHATWINLIAGPYTQSHAHQDQGSLMIYKDGWLGYDAVINSSSGLTQATTAHSLVRIDSGGAPVRQVASTTSTLAGLLKTATWTYAAADLTAAYAGSSAVSKVQREIVFLPPNVIVVYDRVNTAAGTQQTWQLATPVSPSISGANSTITGSGHTLSVQRLAPAATSSVHAMTAESDYNGGYRLDETIAGGNQRYLHVLSIDGAATAVASANDSTVSLTAGGKSVTVAFNRDTVGATLTVNGAATTLGATVQTLAE